MTDNRRDPFEMSRMSSTRLVRRSASPQLAFIPYGLVPLIGLVLLFVFALVPFAGGWVQDKTRLAAQQALHDAGADWAIPEVSGQWVTLKGVPASRADADIAVDAVRKARAGTLFGSATPATRVTENFTWPAGGAQPLANTAAIPFPATPENVAACEQSLAGLLAEARIEFPTASSEIDADGATRLESVARAAAACPGTLRVEGHTDNVGRATFNHELSRRRAEAVRAALVRGGLPAAHLVAEGFGADKPVAGNDTEAGRARNRRIEIRVADQPT
ncbi:MAG: OmpA family protein [Hyphomonadaceae bacterium]|nr:OmpA family protein [Hyphomonadaceae bacterium]